MHKYGRIVQTPGFDAKFSEFKIQNIVGSCDAKFPVCSEGLAYSHGQFIRHHGETGEICCDIRVLNHRRRLSNSRKTIYSMFNTVLDEFCTP